MFSRFSSHALDHTKSAGSRLSRAASLICKRVGDKIKKPGNKRWGHLLWKLQRGHPSTTLYEMCWFEQETGYPIFAILEQKLNMVKRDAAMSSVVPDRMREVSDELHADLVKRGAMWTLGYANRISRVYTDWAIPRDLADKHKMKYHDQWDSYSVKPGEFVLSGCGHVVRVVDIKVSRKSAIIATSHGIGIRAGGRRWFNLFRSTAMLDDPMPEWAQKIMRKHRVLTEWYNDIELDTFAATYSALGDANVAYMVTKNTNYVSQTKLEAMLSSEKVTKMVSDRTREAMRKELKRRGLSSESGEGYVISKHMDLIDKIMDTDQVQPGTLKLVHESLSELSQYLDMKDERNSTTTTSRLQLTTGMGNLVAQQIEQQRKASDQQEVEQVEPEEVKE